MEVKKVDIKEDKEFKDQKESTYKYGCFGATPRALQCMNKAWIFLLLMCLANTFQSGTVNGLIGVSLSSIERRFSFSSYQSSFIANAYDIASIPMLIAVSILGARGHRPRWLGIGLTFLALGSIIFITPRIITRALFSPYQVGDRIDGDNLCGENFSCDSDSVGTVNYQGLFLAIFIIGRLFHGMGATPLYTMGVTYIDDCVDKPTFSLYVALFYAFGVLGPALGYIGGGQLLNVWTEVDRVDVNKLGITPDDPRWVGAWWIAFIVAAIPLFIIAIPFFGFPRDLPGAVEIRAQKGSEAYNAVSDDGADATEGSWADSAKDLPKLLKGLLTNPTYIFVTISSACDSLLIAAFTAFGPKYVETQFSMAASNAGALFGLIVIPGGAGGTVAGGAYIKRLGLSVIGILRSIIIVNMFIIFFVFIFFIVCDRPSMAGLDTGYLNGTERTLDAACNSVCNCTDVKYDPICSVENIKYYSPCHAGCQSIVTETPKKYFNCSCISPMISTGHVATSEVCSSPSCRLMPLFMVLFFMVMFMVFTISAMNISATVRSVKVPEKSLAIGIQWIVTRVIGTIPGPLLLGAAFDGSCSLWDRRCGSQGSCLVYDNHRLALYVFLVCLAVKMFGNIMCLFGWKLYKPPHEDSNILEVNIDNKTSKVNPACDESTHF